MSNYLSPPTPTPSVTKGALSGLLGAGVAVAVGELFAGLFSFFASPFLTVAQKFIALTPRPLKEFAIEQFGENDKIVLLLGAGLFVVIFGIVLGILSRKRPIIGYAGIAFFGVVALWAAVTGAPGFIGGASLFIAVPAGIATLAVLLQSASDSVELVGADSEGQGRRSFLAMSGLALLGAAFAGGAGRLLGGRFTATASREGVKLAAATSEAAAIPASASFEGAVPFITPFDTFYRVDTAISVPQVRAEDFNLRIFGMVDQELNFSYEDLMSRDLIDRVITLTCVSNTVGGSYMGTAVWRGILLKDLLDEAGVQSGADQIVGRAVDDYTAGFPAEVGLDGRDAMLVLGMNGEPLPIERGFPARLIVPGLFGYVSATKWLKEIEVTTFDAFDQYWVANNRGWDERAPIKTQSRIDTPRGITEGSIPAGKTAIAGVAWAQTKGITKVELKIDQDDWVEVELADEVSLDTWRQWRYEWDATPGNHNLMIRATDGTGEVQTEERADVFPNGASGWMNLLVRVA